ncbi:unnamed protein product, partial [Dibothriocephalus latus]
MLWGYVVDTVRSYLRVNLSADKLSELAVITSDDALSNTPQGASTQRSSTASFSAASQLSTAAVAAAAAAQLLCQQKDDVGFSTGSLSNSGLLFPLGGGVGGQALTEAQRQFGGQGLS